MTDHWTAREEQHEESEPLSMCDRAKADAHKSLLERAKRAEGQLEEANRMLAVRTTEAATLLERVFTADRERTDALQVSAKQCTTFLGIFSALREAGIDTDDPAAGVRELAAQRDAECEWLSDLVVKMAQLDREELEGALHEHLYSSPPATPPAPPEEPAPEPRCKHEDMETWVLHGGFECGHYCGDCETMVDRWVGPPVPDSFIALDRQPVPAPEPAPTCGICSESIVDNRCHEDCPEDAAPEPAPEPPRTQYARDMAAAESISEEPVPEPMRAALLAIVDECRIARTRALDTSLGEYTRDPDWGIVEDVEGIAAYGMRDESVPALEPAPRRDVRQEERNAWYAEQHPAPGPAPGLFAEVFADLPEEPTPEPLDKCARCGRRRDVHYGGSTLPLVDHRFEPVPAPEPAPEPRQPKCPTCDRRLRKVTQDTGSPLNAEQFDADKAGDWYCDTCPPHVDRKTRANVRYWWDRELPVPAPEPAPDCLICHGKGYTVDKDDEGGIDVDDCEACESTGKQAPVAAPDPERAEPATFTCPCGCVKDIPTGDAPAEPVGRDVPPPGWSWEQGDGRESKVVYTPECWFTLSEAWARYDAEHQLGVAAIEAEHERKVGLLTEHRALCVAALRKVQEEATDVGDGADIFDIVTEALHRLDESADGGGL